MTQSTQSQPTWLSRLWNSVGIGLLLGFIVSAVLLGVFGYLTDEIVEGDTFLFDNQIATAVRTLVNPTLTKLMIFVTSFGEWWMMTIIGLIVGITWWRQGKRGRVVLLATSAWGGAALDQVEKLLVHRPRPDILGHLVTVQGF